MLAASIGLACLLHAVLDTRAARRIGRLDGIVEERDRPEGAVAAVATPGATGRVYVASTLVRQGRGAFRAGHASVPVLQLLAPPPVARRWLGVSAAAFAVVAALLFALGARTLGELAGRNPTFQPSGQMADPPPSP